MLLNLKTEIVRKRLSAARIASSIGISERSMSCKIHEKVDFTRSEMYAIHGKFFPETDMRYLFESADEH